jgi:hypothetical protein
MPPSFLRLAPVAAVFGDEIRDGPPRRVHESRKNFPYLSNSLIEGPLGQHPAAASVPMDEGAPGLARFLMNFSSSDVARLQSERA